MCVDCVPMQNGCAGPLACRGLNSRKQVELEIRFGGSCKQSPVSLQSVHPCECWPCLKYEFAEGKQNKKQYFLFSSLQ